MELLRIRTELVDQPGALAAVTAVLAGLQVDVAAVDVLEVDGTTVVDELLLRLPRDVDAGQVRDALRLAGAIEVLSMRADDARGDATVRALELVSATLSSPQEADAPGQALARVAYADFGRLVDVGEASGYPLARRALALGVPAAGRLGPEASPLALPTGWVLWVAPSVPEPGHLAVVVRRMDVRFSATEAARLRALATVLETVTRIAA